MLNHRNQHSSNLQSESTAHLCRRDTSKPLQRAREKSRPQLTRWSPATTTPGKTNAQTFSTCLQNCADSPAIPQLPLNPFWNWTTMSRENLPCKFKKKWPQVSLRPPCPQPWEILSS